MKNNVVVFLTIVLLVGSSFSKCFGENGNTYPYETVCPSGGYFQSGDYYNTKLQCWVDIYGFAQCNCTSYVAWKLNELWDKIGCGNIKFNNKFSTGNDKWGDAYRWKSIAENAWIPVVSYPIEGEVAWWGISKNMPAGHVAFIEKMISGGIIVTEYNYAKCSFSVRQLMEGDPGYPDAFLIIGYETFEARDMGICDDYIASNDPDYSDPGIGGVVFNSSGSTKKPNLFFSEVYFKNKKTKYYDDENVTFYDQVKNLGKSVSSSANVTLEYYRFKGEKINNDLKKIGSGNIKGSNLGSGKMKTESIKFKVPSEEGKYQIFVRVDTKNVVSESNENDNQSANLIFRVHYRPDIKVIDLTLNDGQTTFEEGEIPFAKATFTNDGGEPFIDIPVEWYLDGEFYTDDNIRHWNIEHNDTKHEDTYVPALPVGIHTLKVCAVFDEDKNQADNCLEIQFEVVEPPPPTIPGDLNEDGKVNMLDYAILVENFDQTGENVADINDDGIVNMLDYQILVENFRKTN